MNATNAQATSAASEVAAMTPEQLIGQLFIVGFDGTEPTPEVLDLIRTRHVGGIILFTRNIGDLHQTLALTTALQQAARESEHPYPLLIAIDQENGLVRRLGPEATGLPGNMALGATGSEDLAYEVAQATGRELLALGINMNFAPDADVNNNPANPVIGVRSFGEDPALVARLTAAATRGYTDVGIIATLKHFPGHGDTAVDSHLSLPMLPFETERLEQVELVPFRAGIEAGAPVVMTAHIALPHLAATETLPATLSHEIVTGLLRERLGYEGAVVTDCLEMDAIAAGIGVADGAVLALQAGVDLVLVSHRDDRQRAALDAVEHALADGTLSMETVRAAAARVLALKSRFLSWQRLPDAANLAMVGAPAHQKLAERAYAESITVVRDEQSLLPLRLESGQMLLVVGPGRASVSQAVDISWSVTDMLDEIGARQSNVASYLVAPTASADELEALQRAAAEADIILVVTINAALDPFQAEWIRELVQSGKPIIGIAAAVPYDAAQFPQVGTYLATYEYTVPALAAAMRVIFGEQPARGKLPVTLSPLPTGQP